MTKIWLFIILILVFLASDVSSQDFYDIDHINTIELFFHQDDWEDTLAAYHYNLSDKRLTCQAVINGEPFDSVGVRYKGYSSYSPNQTKNPLNIKLDHRYDDQLIQNYGTIKLSNGYKDPSFVREVLGYEIARKYMPAGRANFCRVSINGEYIGLYSNAQSVDRYFLRSHFHNDENTFIKGEPKHGPGGHGLRGLARLQYFGEDSSAYYNSYELRSEYGWHDLVRLCDIISHEIEAIKEILNVDRALWFMAFHNCLVSLDSPINAPRNFYLYLDEGGRFNIIPWDLNMTFGTFKVGVGESPITIADLQRLSPYHNSDNEKYPLVYKLLSKDRYRKMYLAHMRTILNENFTNGWYIQRIQELRDLIKDDVRADINKFFTLYDFLYSVHDSVSTGISWIPGIAQLMEGRILYLQDHPDFSATPPEIGEIDCYPNYIAPYSTIDFSVAVKQADSVYLAYRQNMADPFKKIKMLDDGIHESGEPEDGIYGASISIAGSVFEYYIYAENEKAAAFSPQRAEYEYYTLSIAGDLVINELMASNDAAVSDQDGEFDDWIEFYNNSENPISLNGYFLTDDLEDTTRWVFPDTILQGHDFLIVWADRDEEQTGLHASFRISADGEDLILLDPDTLVVDQIQFESQETDKSYGRYPNGTGPFITMDATFSAPNGSGTGIDASSNHSPNVFKLNQNYPNPFNTNTVIYYTLPQSGHVSLIVYNVNGQEIDQLVNEKQSANNYRIQWNSTDRPSGVYLYRMTFNPDDGIKSYMEIRKMLLLR